MKAVLDFIKRNKVFVIVTASGLVILGAIVVAPIVQQALAGEDTSQEEPADDSERVIDDDELVDEPDEVDPDATIEPATPEAGIPNPHPYFESGEWSPRLAQAHLPQGDPNPVDKKGKRLEYDGVLMDDPMVAATEFSKQWADPTGGHAAWIDRMRPVMSDDAKYGLEMTSEENIFNLKLTGVVFDLEPAHIASGFYRFIASYEGCGPVLAGTVVPHYDGTWLVDTLTEAVQSTPATRDGICAK